MFDPFLAHHPPVLVHEVDGPDFQDAWKRFAAPGERPLCPVCGEGRAQDRGTSSPTMREWMLFSCGDFIAQEITAG